MKGSGRGAFAGCVVWFGLATGGAAVGVLAVFAAELVWPTPVDGGGALAGAGVLGAVLGRAVLAGFIGTVLGTFVAAWAISRLRRGGRT